MQVITKDSNVMVVALAGNIVAGLATGLRKSFQTHAPSVSSNLYTCIYDERNNDNIIILTDSHSTKAIDHTPRTLGGANSTCTLSHTCNKRKVFANFFTCVLS